MRLLLDEHLSPRAAVALRARGHDAVAVAERSDLHGLADPALLVAAAAESRVWVTRDVGDFARLGSRRLTTRQRHAGVILVPPSRSPRRGWTIGPLIRALEAVLAAYPGDDDLIEEVVWLTPAPDEEA